MFLYSQDLSNSKTWKMTMSFPALFLYSQDLSNSKTGTHQGVGRIRFLYSQDLSNSKTLGTVLQEDVCVFVLSRFK